MINRRPRADFAAMVRGITQHRLRPQTGRVFGFDEVPESFAHFEAQRHFGKVCIRF